jgi:isochorismate synthase
MIDFFIKVKQQMALNLPFVIYSKPNKKKLTGLFQKNDHLYFVEDFTETGFVFAPFEGNQNILIPSSESIKWEAELSSVEEKSTSEVATAENEEAQAHFEMLVQKGIDGISNGVFQKVVLSRKEIVDVPDFDSVTVFIKLVRTYPTAFRYCWFHPRFGLWMGASPERLLKANKNKFFTTSLAGTQAFVNSIEVEWERKEKEEQQFVTDFILEKLQNLATGLTVSSPFTFKAGGLLHLKTEIEGIVNEKANLKELISVLHPTPAVCGLPKLAAKEFILENEDYDREYYTGFLGELNKKGFAKQKLKTDLYVNLRCMQIKNKQAHVYVGCGITEGSIPEKEWKESVNKSMTMKRLLHQQ